MSTNTVLSTRDLAVAKAKREAAETVDVVASLVERVEALEALAQYAHNHPGRKATMGGGLIASAPGEQADE